MSNLCPWVPPFRYARCNPLSGTVWATCPVRQRRFGKAHCQHLCSTPFVFGVAEATTGFPKRRDAVPST